MRDFDFDNVLLTVVGQGDKQRIVPFSFEEHDHVGGPTVEEVPATLCDNPVVRLAKTSIVATIALWCAVPGLTREGDWAVLERARAYVAEYEQNLVAVVADERYVQSAGGSSASAGSSRVLDSEFGWVTIPTLGETVGVREVLRVDGQAVTAERRLRRLLTHPPANPSREFAAILAWSAKHNIGDVLRNVNFPTFTLAYLRTREHDSGTRWSTEATPDGLELRFEERGRTTVIRTADGRRSPARGAFLVEADAGRILRSSLTLPIVTGGRKREYRLDVYFAEDERLGLRVPVRMRERLTSVGGRVELAGEATYINYRRYETGGRLLR